MVTSPGSRFNSSSFLMVNWRCPGMMRFFLLSRAVLPASSRISGQRSSSCRREKRSREKSVSVGGRVTF